MALVDLLWSLVLITAPSVLISGPRSLRDGKRRRLFLLAIAAGLGSAALWFSWSPDRSVLEVFRLGMSNQLSWWQVLACGFTLIAANTALAVRYVHRADQVRALAAGLATGFASSYCISDAITSNPQAGIGALMAYVGTLVCALVFNCLLYACLRL
ncbi:hypothetical protein [Corynebacterium tapiri]|uniref:Uncharacterized protein n=1 Tax=Corynebacterium tapiri TaxID=1448266 RepID=A0A5C4U2S6_9CORY|nr:hypothetical protein [Corynebacterium tapiri]TNL96803.1 hypothetical protein FHE74_07215 [Corynebacterium tapiri]